jgi:uncharacterized membrane protein YecN with MAPEG domain
MDVIDYFLHVAIMFLILQLKIFAANFGLVDVRNDAGVSAAEDVKIGKDEGVSMANDPKPEAKAALVKQQRIIGNDSENLPYMMLHLILSGFVQSTNLDADYTLPAIFGYVFVFCRIFHHIMYAKGLQPFRTATFFFAFLSQLGLACTNIAYAANK